MTDNGKAPIIKAAGGVIYRRDERHRLLFGIVHKSAYGEWALPKGKLKNHETWSECALREVSEETGSSVVLMGPAAVSSYLVNDIPKIVMWFVMEAQGEIRFKPDHEIDRVEWLAAGKVSGRLTHTTEQVVFETLLQRIGK